MSCYKNRKFFTITLIINLFLLYEWRNTFLLKYIVGAGSFVSLIIALLSHAECRYFDENPPQSKTPPKMVHTFYELIPNEYAPAFIEILEKKKETSDYWYMTANELISMGYYAQYLYRYKYPYERCDLYLENGQVTVYAAGVNIGTLDKAEQLIPVLDDKYTAEISAAGGEVKKIKILPSDRCIFLQQEDHEIILYVRVTQYI